MIVYSPLDGDAATSSVASNPRHCFLMTRIGKPIPESVQEIRTAITEVCTSANYSVIDAGSKVTGRDFLWKIWKLIASTPVSIGICHEDISPSTQSNIYYEMGVAQALGKETLIVKSPNASIPSDFIRTEYVEFNADFEVSFSAYLDSLSDQAEHYELVSDQLESNPILAIDYLRRAYLISGDKRLRKKAKAILGAAGLSGRARNSVELLSADF